MEKVKIEQVPDGVVVDRLWLKAKGIDASLVDYYLRKGYLVQVARGAYRRPGDPFKWQHLVYSLQFLGWQVYVGGRTALEVKGKAHYLPLGKENKIHLYREGKLPPWLFKTDVDAKFVEHNQTLFKNEGKEEGMSEILFGSWDWKIRTSSPERALFEMMAEVPKKESFHMVDVVMEGATTLRADLINDLLLYCTNIKVKRLFLWFAEKHNHKWFERLKTENVDLGKGKREILKGGKLDPKYLITVPRETDDRQEQSIF
ncbi:MAG: type IV toxin-antitoxin system AbiEi family antitoxin domain-containing protein [Candidatus Omnitrophota bacterium]